MLPDHEYHALTVVDVIDETSDTRSYVLDIPRALEASFAYAAGQYCAFRAPIDGEPVVRCYSMSSSPDAGDPFTTTVKRVDGGRMSNWMNDVLARGDTIEVMRPAGLFVLRDTDVPIVAFAGGSGITPVISILKSALVTTAREITLVYANRSAEAIIFASELDRLREEYPARLTVHHHLDAERGFLDAAACAALVGECTHADFYICGPGPYMDTAQAGLELLDVEPAQLFLERFVSPDEIGTVGGGSATEKVVIRLARQTHAVDYQTGDTILETARRAGLSPPYSCEAGSCATCMAHLDQGSASMRVNNALAPEEVEEGWVLTCQAIPASPEVVVDYDA